MSHNPGPNDPDDEGPEEIDDVDEISGGFQLPDTTCIPSPPIDDPFRDWNDPLGDATRTLEL